MGSPGRRRARRLDERRAPRGRRAGAPDRSVLVAEHQDAGRGRLGREWVSPPGAGVTVSVLLRPATSRPTVTAGCRSSPGWRCATPSATWFPLTVCLKWPNDLLVGAEQRKAGGILAEAASGPDGTAVVLGIGLNVAGTPAELPAGATSLAAEGGRGGGPDEGAGRRAHPARRARVGLAGVPRRPRRPPPACGLPRGLQQPRCRGAGGAARRDGGDGHGRRRRRRRPAAAARCRRAAPGDRGGGRRAPAAGGRPDRARADGDRAHRRRNRRRPLPWRGGLPGRRARRGGAGRRPPASALAGAGRARAGVPAGGRRGGLRRCARPEPGTGRSGAGRPSAGSR